MSAIDQPKQKILHSHDGWNQMLWRHKNIKFDTCGNLIKVHGFTKYNKLIDINSIFSSRPSGMINDRTGLCVPPLNLKIHRLWQVPGQRLNLDQAMAARVSHLLNLNLRVNIFWSGGIDSTALLTAFLKHAPDLSKLRVLYTPFSVYEHPGYLNFLQNFSNLETVDISGEIYYNNKFDGVFVTGDGGDEFSASIDESFIGTHGIETLHKPWRDFFYDKNPDSKFIEFCEEYFAHSGKEINSVLEARWWFYSICKTRCVWSQKLEFFLHYENFNPDMIVPFYDCDELENYFYWNTDQIIPGNTYCNWKKSLKQYCYEFDQFEDWFKNKSKVNSHQLSYYSRKNILLSDRRYMFLLEDGSTVSTASLPFFNYNEFVKKYGSSLDYLYNEPD